MENKYAELPWAERRSRLVDALLSTGELDVIGFQEVYHNQLLDLAALLGPSYGHVGVGRDDGKEAGEYSPIFYDRTKFEVVKWRTIWLSPTPDIPGSKGWDASQTRIATHLSLRNDDSKQLIHVVNTHYDDQGTKARAFSSLMIREHIVQWVKFIEGAENQYSKLEDRPVGPVILLGDFNSPPQEHGYRNITSPKPLQTGQPSFTFLDSHVHLRTRQSTSTPSGPFPPRQSAPYGPLHTYTGFAAPGKSSTSRIDFVMLASAILPGDEETMAGRGVGRGGWEVTRYACVDNWVEEGDVNGWQGRWSDHRAVRATISRVVERQP